VAQNKAMTDRAWMLQENKAHITDCASTSSKSRTIQQTAEDRPAYQISFFPNDRNDMNPQDVLLLLLK
jgi:hypothetical protein